MEILKTEFRYLKKDLALCNMEIAYQLKRIADFMETESKDEFVAEMSAKEVSKFIKNKQEHSLGGK